MRESMEVAANMVLADREKLLNMNGEQLGEYVAKAMEGQSFTQIDNVYADLKTILYDIQRSQKVNKVEDLAQRLGVDVSVLEDGDGN